MSPPHRPSSAAPTWTGGAELLELLRSINVGVLRLQEVHAHDRIAARDWGLFGEADVPALTTVELLRFTPKQGAPWTTRDLGCDADAWARGGVAGIRLQLCRGIPSDPAPVEGLGAINFRWAPLDARLPVKVSGNNGEVFAIRAVNTDAGAVHHACASVTGWVYALTRGGA